MTNDHETDIDLTQFDDAYAAAPAEDEDVPDGKYEVIVEEVELTHSKSSGKPMLRWQLKIIGPDQIGRRLWRHNMLAMEENIVWLKKDLHRCGLDLPKLSDLPERLGELLDLGLDVTKRTRGEFENIFINRRLNVTADPETDRAGTPF